MAFWKLFLVLFHRYSRVFQIPYYLDELKLTRLSLVLHIEGTHYMRQYTYGTKVHFFTIRVEGGRTIQGEILIEKSALTRQYSKVLIWSNYLQLIKKYRCMRFEQWLAVGFYFRYTIHHFRISFFQQTFKSTLWIYVLKFTVLRGLLISLIA